MSEAEKNLLTANAFLDDVTPLVHPPGDVDQEKAREILHLLKLAGKSIAKAEKQESQISIVVGGDKDTKTLTASDLRATCLVYEGIARGIGLGEERKGIKCLEKSIEISPEFSNSHFLLSLLYSDSGDKKKALTSLNKAIELDPDNIGYKQTLEEIENRSSLFTKLGRFHGSWLVFGILLLFSLFSFIAMSASEVGSSAGSLMAGAFWAVVALIYFKVKSR
jgi:tetratricopeptide (TPR) repeat protein